MNDVQKAVVQHMVEALEQATLHLPVHTDWHFEAIAAGKALIEQPAQGEVVVKSNGHVSPLLTHMMNKRTKPETQKGGA